MIVFGETWLSGYPSWLDHCPNIAIWDHEPTKEVFLKIEILSKSYFQNIFDSNKNEYVKVKDLFKINENKIKLSVDDTKMVSFVPMASVSEKSKSITEKKLRKFSEVKKGYTPIKRDDLIVAKITPCYENGKMAIADEIEGDIAFGSTEFHTFRSSDKRMIIFLFQFIFLILIKKKFLIIE